MSKLLLFDIDGTLIDTGGAGMKALKEAACELFGADGPELDLAGSTDSGIVMGMADHFDRVIDHDHFFQIYLDKLSANLPSFSGRVLPGVSPLLDQLYRGEQTLGLLTGNMAGGAWRKLEHYDLKQYFDFGAFGDDHHNRNQLGPVALARAAAATGKDHLAEHTVIIGDTPKDIACGKAIGARTLAVATGPFDCEQLAAYDPDLVVEDLTCPRGVNFLMS